MPNIVVQLHNVRKTYGEGTPVACEVLHGIDLDVRGGELTALIAPSGSGKSTLLNLLGLLDQASTGTSHLDGVNTTELDPDARTRLRGEKIGFVFQFHHLLPAFTALENVLLPAQAQRRWRTHAMVQRARMLLDTGTADQVFGLFRRLLLERGSAALVVTHDPRLAERADRVMTLVDGRIVSDVRPARLGVG